MQEAISLKNNNVQHYLIYFLLGGLVMIFTVSTAVFIYLDRKAQKTHYQPASSRGSDSQNEGEELGRYGEADSGSVTQNGQRNADTDENKSKIEDQVRINEEESNVEASLDEQQDISESDVDLVQDKDDIKMAMQTGLLGVSSQKVEGVVYKISADKKRILSNNSTVLDVGSGQIKKFVKVPWLDKVFVIVRLSNKSYALKEYTLLGSTPLERLMYRYEGVFKMVNFYVPSDYIEESSSPRLFFVFYVYETPKQTRFMVQRVKGVVASKYVIQKYAGNFGGVQDVYYDRNKGSIKVKVLIGNKVVEETYFE